MSDFEKSEKEAEARVDSFASIFLVNFGIINGAALAIVTDGRAPFALGLVCALAAQIFWYTHEVGGLIKKSYEKDCKQSLTEGPLAKKVRGTVEALTVFFGLLSAACPFYAGLMLVGVPACLSIFLAVILVILPFVLLFLFATNLALKAN